MKVTALSGLHAFRNGKIRLRVWWNTEAYANEIFMNGEMILHSAVQQRKRKFQPTVIAKPSINYWKQAVMPVSMETLSHMYYIFFVLFLLQFTMLSCFLLLLLFVCFLIIFRLNSSIAGGPLWIFFQNHCCKFSLVYVLYPFYFFKQIFKENGFRVVSYL